MDRGTWWATVPGITKSWMQLSTHVLEILLRQVWRLPDPRIVRGLQEQSRPELMGA